MLFERITNKWINLVYNWCFSLKIVFLVETNQNLKTKPKLK